MSIDSINVEAKPKHEILGVNEQNIYDYIAKRNNADIDLSRKAAINKVNSDIDGKITQVKNLGENAVKNISENGRERINNFIEAIKNAYGIVNKELSQIHKSVGEEGIFKGVKYDDAQLQLTEIINSVNKNIASAKAGNVVIMAENIKELNAEREAKTGVINKEYKNNDSYSPANRIKELYGDIKTDLSKLQEIIPVIKDQKIETEVMNIIEGEAEKLVEKAIDNFLDNNIIDNNNMFEELGISQISEIVENVQNTTLAENIAVDNAKNKSELDNRVAKLDQKGGFYDYLTGGYGRRGKEGRDIAAGGPK